MLKFCLQGKGLEGKRVATLTEIKNRNATTVGDSHIIMDGQWAGMTHHRGCLQVRQSHHHGWSMGWHDTSSQLSSCEWCRIIVSGQAGSVAAVSEQATPSL